MPLSSSLMMGASGSFDKYRPFDTILIQPRSTESSILDFSASPKTVTIDGTVSLIGVPSIWESHRGCQFDGSGRLTIASPGAAPVGIVPFVVEAALVWAVNQDTCIYQVGATGGFGLFYGGYKLYATRQGVGNIYAVDFSPTIGTPYHILYSRSVDGADMYSSFYINGARVGVGNDNYNYPAGASHIGAMPDMSYASKATISMTRVSVGTDRGMVGFPITNAVTRPAYR